ncbi:MAG: hypothetical protein C5B50_13405 [Verrucomicrobia bacterium]|nr:MAG: hypothetical protein C5B50_13405 [Verrucomicrobiota bacterium]
MASATKSSCRLRRMMVTTLGLGLTVASFAYVQAQPVFGTQTRIGYPAGDDWEPALAADRYGHLYVVYYHTDVKGQAGCTGCSLHLLIQRSSDGGVTWSDPVPIAPGPVNGGQFDPWLVVDPSDGRTLWFSFMQGFPQSQIELVKSTDFGVTWSAPTVVSGSLNKLDKDVLAVGGGTLAAFFDDYYTLYASLSTDGGLNWTLHSLFTFHNAPKQLLCSGAGIDSLGKLFSAWDVYDSTSATPCKLWLEKSSDGGQTWIEQDIDVGGDPYPCSQCGAGAYLAPQITLRIGSDDTIYLLWNTTTNLASGAPERIFFSKSTDHGQTFSPRQDVSSAPAGTEHCFPCLAVGAGSGDVRIAWMDNRTGVWNGFYRASTNGGATFSGETRLSGYVPGYSYLTNQGFQFPYGDYFQLAVDRCGGTHAAFGETSAYSSPGNIWIANEQPTWHLAVSYQAGGAKLTWPASFASAGLQFATSPTGPWGAYPTRPSLTNNQWTVVEPLTSNPARFFRLRCP